MGRRATGRLSKLEVNGLQKIMSLFEAISIR